MARNTLVIGLISLSLVACSSKESEVPAQQEGVEPSAAVPASAEPGSAAEEETDSVPELTVEVAADLFQKKQAVPVDANGESTRNEQGVVPGAILLTSSGQYDTAKELPADKSTALVFYCGSTRCTASDGAAERAQAEGYTNVKVMRPGIKGWVEAGMPIAKPDSKS